MTHIGMTRALPRTNFNSSRLTRFLADLSVVDAAESKQAFAERLGEWLDFTDAITLHALHNTRQASPGAAQFKGQTVAGNAIRAEFARVRANLASSITKSCSPAGGEARIKWPSLPTPSLGGGSEIVADYEPFHRFYLAHQRDMEASIRPMRARVRLALSQASPGLRQLAALDAALDKILFDRERKLLSTVPLLLEKRFGQLLGAHQASLTLLVDSLQVDSPDMSTQPGAWLADFCNEMQGALLAELDLRLQATIGLIEAFSEEANKHK